MSNKLNTFEIFDGLFLEVGKPAMLHIAKHINTKQLNKLFSEVEKVYVNPKSKEISYRLSSRIVATYFDEDC